MNVLVTGATGLIGNALARRLVARGDTVRALVRDLEKATRVLPPEVKLVRGDVTAPDSLPAAVQGVDQVFHSAGMPEQWQRDDSIFDRVNRQGTVNVLKASLDAKVKRVIYTSTMDVFAAPRGGTLVETNIDSAPKPTAYERSKQAAEREAELFRQQGLDLVYVNPAAVYGPSPVHVGLNSFFIRLLNRQMPLLPPGGVSVAYVDGVTDVHLAAAGRGLSGERYLVADEHANHAELARATLQAAGRPLRVPPVAPAPVLKVLSAGLAPLARIFGFTPLIAPGQLSFLLWDAHVDASKAQRELGFRPTPLAEGVARTIAFLRQEKLVPQD
ncbi:SDR family NAD(P)-dependent oxidoreductase [Hyalangium sp.]|uniref:SDR family NAD(P)-dependent oxidoreductase n=1 Tax=Hyalangium sp. TaxID=2028555 RepID=UPI002D7279ED|nr:SDR family NAD(P)-dependent oxidoreductase [Hyalangium sp.]HYH94422.1 SDR family NAD(P)-dependent oxidoreductase [Hyalangium sp.]